MNIKEAIEHCWDREDYPEVFRDDAGLDISIPGFNKMYFNQSKNPKVNFYNPKENTCTMTMELYLNDGSLL